MRSRIACLLLSGLGSILWMATPLMVADAAAQACTSIATVNDLSRIKRNMAGSYCLANDLDLAGVAFQPLARRQAFTGTFDGQGHVIRNLTINSGASNVGLFGFIEGGTVSNLTLAGVSIAATHSGSIGALTGALAGGADGGTTISNVRVTGTVTCPGHFCRAGGLVGQLFSGTIQDSSADASVTGGTGGAAGGLVGQVNDTVIRSYATGIVNCSTHCAAGGLTGQLASGWIDSSFATGPVTASRVSNVGGLVGTLDTTVTHAYATGRVTTRTDAVAALAASFGGTLTEVFAAGRVQGAPRSQEGGLTAESAGTTTSGYWDINTTRQATSIAGVGKRTRQLQAALPAGFGSAWAITKGFSYPYLNLLDSGMFASTLASVVHGRQVYTFVPIGQLEPTEYSSAPAHADAASFAAVVTMIARGIGRTAQVDVLSTAKIDAYWNDDQQSTTIAAPLTDYVQIGDSTAIAGGQAIDDSNVIGALKAGHLVIINGTAGDSTQHSMLATLFTSDSGGATTALVANDPWTGTQVRIDPTTKQVTFPTNFPLIGFTVNSYSVVTQVTPPRSPDSD